MPRVALLFEYPTLNGGELSMLAALKQRPADDVVALAPGSGPLADALRDLGIEVRPFDCRDSDGVRLPRATLIERLVHAVAEVRPDLLHANSLAMGRLAGAAAARLAIPTTAHLRDIIGLSAAAAADLNRNRRLAAVSEATRAFHTAQGIGRNPDVPPPPNGRPPIDILPNGVDLDRFQPRPATGWLRESLQLSSEALLIATIGQIALRKGHDVLARAAVLAAQRIPHAHYVIAGERHSSKEESVAFERQLTATFTDAGLENRLHHLGRVGDIAGVLREVDLLAHPARQEPLGRVLLEAAAAGVPIVATDVGGTSEILEDGVSARLIPPDDPRALAEALCELTESPALRERFAAQARWHIERNFDVRLTAPKLASFWRTALEA